MLLIFLIHSRVFECEILQILNSLHKKNKIKNKSTNGALYKSWKKQINLLNILLNTLLSHFLRIFFYRMEKILLKIFYVKVTIKFTLYNCTTLLPFVFYFNVLYC